MVQVCEDVREALQGVTGGKDQVVMVGGFGLSGIPENIIEHVRTRDDIKDLYIISTEAGDDGWGLGRLYEKNKISKQWASYIGRCHGFEKAYLEGRTEVELMPQGTVSTIASRILFRVHLRRSSWRRRSAARPLAFRHSTHSAVCTLCTLKESFQSFTIQMAVSRPTTKSATPVTLGIRPTWKSSLLSLRASPG